MRLKGFILSEAEKFKIYFAHPREFYNTSMEMKAIKMIKKKWPNGIVINPNSDKFEAKFKKIGFEIFYRTVKICKIGAFMLLKDRKWSDGIYKEAVRMQKLGKEIYEVNPWKGTITPITKDMKSIKPLTPEQTWNRLTPEKKDKYYDETFS